MHSVQIGQKCLLKWSLRWIFTQALTMNEYRGFGKLSRKIMTDNSSASPLTYGVIFVDSFLFSTVKYSCYRKLLFKFCYTAVITWLLTITDFSVFLARSVLVIWGKKFQDSLVVKGFLCSTSWNRDYCLRTVSCNVFSIQWALIWVIDELCSVLQTRVITKTKQLIRKISWILWRSPLFQLLFLATRSTKESSLHWFELHFPLFKWK